MTSSPAAAVALTLRAPSARDRGAVEAMLRETGVFREDEVAIGLEVFDGSVAGDAAYHSIVAELGGGVAGWICWGRTPCTVGTWDMYWLVVSPSVHGAGIGSRLVSEMERRLAGVARLIVVETAGRADYAPTRAFYEARGYRRAATIPDFYAPGDDQVVYTKFFYPSTDSHEGR